MKTIFIAKGGNFYRTKITSRKRGRKTCLGVLQIVFFEKIDKKDISMFYFLKKKRKKDERFAKQRVKDNERTKIIDTIKTKIILVTSKVSNVTVLSCVMRVSCVVLPQTSLRKTHKVPLRSDNEESHVTPFGKTRYHSSTEVIKQITPPTKNGRGGVWSDVTWFCVFCVSVCLFLFLFISLGNAVFSLYSKTADTAM